MVKIGKRRVVVASVAALAGAVALLTASSASAQVPVVGFVDVLGSHLQVGYNNTASCDSTTECSVTVPIGHRDFNRLTKSSCGTMATFPTFDVTVANPSSGTLLSNTITCTSPRYTILVFGQYEDITPTTPVLIHVTVTS
jgi:hypothetical protein